MDIKNINISLEELTEVEGLSARAKNLCEDNYLIDINTILDFYYWNHGFSKLRNCGFKSNEELINICLKYEKKVIKTEPREENEKVKYEEIYTTTKSDKIGFLTSKQKQTLNNLIDSQVNELSARSLNALTSYLGDDISLKSIKPILTFQDKEIKRIHNIGEKTVEEIKDLINYVNEQIEFILSTENENKLSINLFNTFLTRKFYLKPSIIEEITVGHDFSNGLLIFRTLKFLIDNEILFDRKEKEIFISGFNYFNNSTVKILNEQGAKLNVTRERARQIRLKIFQNLSNKFSFLKRFELDAFNLYGLDYTNEIIDIDEDFVEEINNFEGTNCNSIFITKILSVLLSDKYLLIGNEECLVFNKTIRTAHNWKSTYLVLKEYANNFDFDKFVEDISFNLSQIIDEDYCLHFKAYLLKFQKNSCSRIFEDINKIAEYILFKEFELTINSEDNIVFSRNTKKQVIDYVHKVLEEENKPLTVFELFDIIEHRHPGIVKNIQALRASCLRASSIIPFGRSSTYGLKVWENNFNIKGGTIRNITEEYLQKQKEPKHINEITEYVNQFRRTTTKNIYTNLKIDVSNTFLFLRGSYIGLSYKDYSANNIIETERNNYPADD